MIYLGLENHSTELLIKQKGFYMMPIKSSLKMLTFGYLILGILFTSVAYSEDWLKLGEQTESPKFGKTVYYVDVDSIKVDGDIRTVWLKSIFSKPQVYKEGKTYTDFRSFTYFNCPNKKQAVTQIDVYRSDGQLVGSGKQGINYLPISEGSLDDLMYKFVCSYKKVKN